MKYIKNMQQKIFIIFFSFTIALMISLIFFLMTIYTHNLRKEIEISNQRLIKQIQLYLDNNIFKTVDIIFNNQVAPLKSNDEVISILDDEQDLSINDYKTAFTNIYYLTMLNPNLESVTLYKKNPNVLIDSTLGIIDNLNDKNNHYKDLIPYDLYNKVMLSDHLPLWISPTEDKTLYSNRSTKDPIITYAHSYPLFSDIEHRSGGILISLNLNQILNNMHSIYNSEMGNLLIINDDGRIFSDFNKEEEYHNISDFSYFKEDSVNHILSDNEGFLILPSSEDNTSLGITWITAKNNRFKYITVTPLSTLHNSLYATKKIAIYILIIGVIITFIGAQIISNSLYKPLSKLLNMIQKSSLIENTQKDEFKYINQVVEKLTLEISDLKVVKEQNKKLIEYKLCNDILHDKVRDITKVNEKLCLLDKNFDQQHFYYVLVQLDRNIIQQLTIEQNEILHYKIMDYLNEYYRYNDQTNNIMISTEQDLMITILNTPDCNLGAEYFTGLQRIIQIETGVNTNIIYSTCLEDLLEVHKSHSDLLPGIHYTFINGYGCLYSETDIRNFEKNNGYNRLKEFAYFEQLLNCGDIKSLRTEIQKMFLDLKQSNYAYNYIQSVLLQLVNLIVTTSKKKEINLDKQKISIIFQDIETLSDFEKWIDLLISDYETHYASSNLSLHRDFMKEVEKFIRENLHDEICLQFVANKFNMSKTYLSKLFNESMGMTFSDYIVNAKLEKAAELLIKQPNLCIGEISESLGYTTKPYFSQLFKKKYGYTPLQYRKKYGFEK